MIIKKNMVAYPGKDKCSTIELTDKQIEKLGKVYRNKTINVKKPSVENLLIWNSDTGEIAVVMPDYELESFTISIPVINDDIFVLMCPVTNEEVRMFITTTTEKGDEILARNYKSIMGIFEANQFYLEQQYYLNRLLYFIIQDILQHPEEVFNEDPVTGKHRIKLSKSRDKNGKDEKLYTVLMNIKTKESK